MQRLVLTLAVTLALFSLVDFAAAQGVQRAAQSKPRFDAPPAPDQWTETAYSDGVGYWPATGTLARGSTTGYLKVIVYHPMSLDGRALDGMLSAFVAGQEQHFNVQRRGVAVMDGPHMAWDYLQSKNKNGVLLDVSYLAIHTGPDTVRIVKEILTDDDYEDRYGYVRAIETLYRFVENEVPPAFRSETSPATVMQLMTKMVQTESSKSRRAREKRARASASKRRVRSVSSAPGQGIALDGITGVFMRSGFLERAYGGKDADVDIYVLLKDGTAYRHPTRPPSDINREASRRVEAGQWLQWRHSDGAYQVRSDADAPWQAMKGELGQPAPSTTMQFTGKHIAAWGDILSGTAGHRTGRIELTADGRYETSSFALAGGAGITGLPAAVVSVSTGKDGRQTTTNSNVAPALINNVKRDPDGTDFTGQYALKGYTAEFLSDSGQLKRTLFLMTASGDVYVGGRYYSIPEK